MGKKNKNNLILGGLLAVVLLLAVGYAAFATNLNIGGISSIDSRWDVHIKNNGVNPDPNNTVAATSVTAQKDSQLTGSFSCNLTTPGISTIDYIIEVENSGTFGAKLSSINITGETAYIGASLSKSSLTQGEVIASGGEDTITVTVSYKDVDIAPTLQADKTVAITVTLNFVQDDEATINNNLLSENVNINFSPNLSNSFLTAHPEVVINPISTDMNSTITMPNIETICLKNIKWRVANDADSYHAAGTQVLVSDLYNELKDYYEEWEDDEFVFDGNITMYASKQTKRVKTNYHYMYDNLVYDNYSHLCTDPVDFALSRNGYTLDGWYTGENGTGLKITSTTTGEDLIKYLNLGINYDENTPIDLYANWIAN